jgi:Two component regulator propeller
MTRSARESIVRPLLSESAVTDRGNFAAGCRAAPGRFACVLRPVPRGSRRPHLGGHLGKQSRSICERRFHNRASRRRRPTNPTSLFEDRSGRLWIGTIAELFYLVQGTLVKFHVASGILCANGVLGHLAGRGRQSLVRYESGSQPVCGRQGHRLHQSGWFA